ncbi:hypothetical protein ACK8HX_07265 [Oryzobacter sp. R7]|uniref:hypothetical protein n=1 Tax=Oryzobacter faecalis TaxID=3388656 RepID=UPI00398C9C95
MWASTTRVRWGLALGGLTALILTQACALSFFSAYGSPDEMPPRWLAAMEAPLSRVAVIAPGSTTVHDLYGLVYLGAWVLGLTGFARGLALRRSSFTVRLRRSWSAVLVGLGLVAIGIFGDYAIPNDMVGGIGFMLTGLGFVATSVALVVLGIVLRRDAAVGLPSAWMVAALGAGSVTGGTALVGHVPSGPGLGFALAALVLAATRRGDPEAPGRGAVQSSP